MNRFRLKTHKKGDILYKKGDFVKEIRVLMEGKLRTTEDDSIAVGG